MAPLRVGITGANGFIGSALCASVQDVGLVARRIVRELPACEMPLGRSEVAADGGDSADGADAVAVGEIDGNTNWGQALRGCDVVIHLAAHQSISRQASTQADLAFDRVNTCGTMRLATQAAASGVKRFIFISTVKIHGEVTQAGSPWVETSPSNPQDLYSQSKWQAEAALVAAAAAGGMEWVIIRPPMVYGPGLQRSNIRSLARWVARGVPLPLGGIQNQRSMIALPNLIDFILLCTAHPSAANQCFLISDDHDLSIPALIQKMALCSRSPARIFSVPVGALRIFATLLGQTSFLQRLTGNLQVDISKAKSLLGWHPPHTVEDGLRYFLRDEIGKKVV